jgi:hypothetical protein
MAAIKERIHAGADRDERTERKPAAAQTRAQADFTTLIKGFMGQFPRTLARLAK